MLTDRLDLFNLTTDYALDYFVSPKSVKNIYIKNVITNKWCRNSALVSISPTKRLIYFNRSVLQDFKYVDGNMVTFGVEYE